jgi:hypothetical protein
MARCATHTGFVSSLSKGLVVTVESVSPPNILSGPVNNIVPNTPIHLLNWRCLFQPFWTSGSILL